MEMPDARKVIRGLECCDGYCDDETGCPYFDVFEPFDCQEQLRADAIALLKAQEPRTMTMEEAKGASGYVFVQSRTCNILALHLIKDGLMYHYILGPTAVDDLWWEGYNKQWRLWTSCPTDEQREAEPWT